MTVENDKIINLNTVERIRNHCLDVLTCTSKLRGNPGMQEAYSSAEEVLMSVRKLYLTSLMYQKKLICISGLQGVGKTTLMQQFYGLDDQILPTTRGRGERIPVLITEKAGLSAPTLFAIKIETREDGQYDAVTKPIHGEEYAAAVSGEDKHIMYLELQVPHRHTYNEGTSFVLLPGFETKNKYWNDLIEFAVNSSDAAVFVFGASSFSYGENETYLRRIESKFGKNLVYVITGSDTSADGNAEVKRTCISTLEIPTSESDRVVCSGVYRDENQNKQWIDALKDALEKYTYRQSEQFQQNSEYVYGVLCKIQDLLYSIQSVVNDVGSGEPEQYKNNSLLNAFDHVKNSMRKDLKRSLEKELGVNKETSCKKVAEEYDALSKQGLLERLGKLFTGPDVKQAFIIPRQILERSLKKNNIYLPEISVKRAAENFIESLQRRSGSRTDLNRLIATTVEGGEIQLIEEKTTALNQDICTLLREESGDEQPALQNDDDKRLMRAMAELCTLYYCTQRSMLSGSITDNSFISFISDKIILKKGQYKDRSRMSEPGYGRGVENDMKQGMTAGKKFIAGLAGMLGLDLLPDGKMNMLEQVATSLGINVTSVAITVGLIAAAGAAVAVKRDFNQMMRNDCMSVVYEVNDLYDRVKQDELALYDDFMSRIRERLEDNLNVVSGAGKRGVLANNALAAIGNALYLLEDMTKKYAGDKYGLEAYIT